MWACLSRPIIPILNYCGHAHQSHDKWCRKINTRPPSLFYDTIKHLYHINDNPFLHTPLAQYYRIPMRCQEENQNVWRIREAEN